MAIKKLFEAKNKDIKVEVCPASVSPAVSSTSSCGSGALLIHGRPSPKSEPKRKAVPSVAKKQLQTKLMNVIWSGLFLMVIVATVVVVAALAENLRRALWLKATYKDDGSSYRTFPSLLEGAYTKVHSRVGDKACLHRRYIWERGSYSSEIIHDISAKWSAIVSHDEGRCLIFDMRSSEDKKCPTAYPWDMDVQIGVPGCRGPLAKIAPIRKIMHHISNSPTVNLNTTGETISAMCSDYKILQIDEVTIHYFDRNFRRVARRSVDSIIKVKPGSLDSMVAGAKNSLTDEATSISSLSVGGATALSKPFENVKLVTNSGEKSRYIPRRKLKGADTVVKPPHKIDEHAVKAPSAVRTTDVPAHGSQPLRKTRMSTTPRPAEKTHMGRLISAVFFKLTRSKTASSSDKVEHAYPGNRIPDGNDVPHWETHYNSVDQNGNVLEARTLDDLIFKTRVIDQRNIS